MHALFHPSFLETFGKSLGLLHLKVLCGIEEVAQEMMGYSGTLLVPKLLLLHLRGYEGQSPARKDI